MASKVVAVRFAVGNGEQRIDGGGCGTFSAILPARRRGIQAVKSEGIGHRGAPRPIPSSRRARGKFERTVFD